MVKLSTCIAVSCFSKQHTVKSAAIIFVLKISIVYSVNSKYKLQNVIQKTNQVEYDDATTQRTDFPFVSCIL